AAQVARILQSLRADLFDHLEERALQQVLSRIAIDASVQEYLQQWAPISHIQLILECAALRNGFHERYVAPIRPLKSLVGRLSLQCFAVAHWPVFLHGLD